MEKENNYKFEHMKISFLLLAIIMMTFFQGCQNSKQYYGLWIIESVNSSDTRMQNLIGEKIGLSSDGCNVPAEGGDTDVYAKWKVSNKGGKKIITFDSEGYFQGDFELTYFTANDCWLELKNDLFSVQMYKFGCVNVNRITK